MAKIVVDSMHGYHLFGHSLVCKLALCSSSSYSMLSRLIPKEKIHSELFKGANRVFKKIPWRKIARAQHNKVTTWKRFVLTFDSAKRARTNGEDCQEVTSKGREEEEAAARTGHQLRLSRICRHLCNGDF